MRHGSPPRPARSQSRAAARHRRSRRGRKQRRCWVEESRGKGTFPPPPAFCWLMVADRRSILAEARGVLIDSPDATILPALRPVFPRRRSGSAMRRLRGDAPPRVLGHQRRVRNAGDAQEHADSAGVHVGAAPRGRGDTPPRRGNTRGAGAGPAAFWRAGRRWPTRRARHWRAAAGYWRGAPAFRPPDDTVRRHRDAAVSPAALRPADRRSDGEHAAVAQDLRRPPADALLVRPRRGRAGGGSWRSS